MHVNAIGEFFMPQRIRVAIVSNLNECTHKGKFLGNTEKTVWGGRKSLNFFIRLWREKHYCTMVFLFCFYMDQNIFVEW